MICIQNIYLGAYIDWLSTQLSIIELIKLIEILFVQRYLCASVQELP